MSLSLPPKYSRIPISTPPGSLGSSLREYQDGLQMNLNAIATSINQTIQALSALDKADTSLAASIAALGRDLDALEVTVTALETSTQAADAALLARMQDYVLLTGSGGGATWDLEDYPNIRAVIVDPNGGSNTLNLPALGASDKLCITVKCLANSGNVDIVSPAGNIITDVGPGFSNYNIPYAIAGTGITATTYAATLIWTGAAWHVIDNAIRAS